MDFGRPSPLGDPFTYDAWEGHSSLVKLNLWQDDEMIVVANSAAQAVSLDIPLPSAGGTYRDVLNPGHEYRAWNGHLRVEKVPSNWGCLLQRLAG